MQLAMQLARCLLVPLVAHVPCLLVVLAAQVPASLALRASRGNETAPTAGARPEPDVASTCQPFPGKRVILTVVNAEYLPMLRNWYVSAQEFLGAADQLVVVTNDWAAFKALSPGAAGAIPGAAVVDPNQTLHSSSLGAAAVNSTRASFIELYNVEARASRDLTLDPYGSAGFTSVVATKPFHILGFLDRGCTVFYVDADTVWTHNPFLDMGKLGAKELYLTDDSQSGASDPVTSTWYLCTCFIYAQPTATLKSFFRTWLKAVPGNKEDQWPFNDELKKFYNSHSSTFPVDFGLLPYREFPPGYSAFSYPGAHIFHANWLVGIDQKIQFFRSRDMWTQ